MTFTIIKKGNNNFWHLFNNGAKEVNLSDFQAVLDSVAQTFIIQALNGANVPQTAVGILDIIVIDETDASLEETFANVEALRTRLVELGYTPYLGAVADNITGLIEAGTNVTITGDGTTGSPYVISLSGGGGGAVTSVNSDTGAVIVDLQSASDEGATTTNAIETGNIIANDINGGDPSFTGKYNSDDGIGRIIMEDNNSGFIHSLRFLTPTSNLEIDFKDESGTVAYLSDIPAPITIDATPTDGSSNAVSSNGVFDVLATKVSKSDYTPAHSILVQQSGTGTPTALSVGNNTLVGRLSGGGSDINDLSVSDVRTLLSIDTDLALKQNNYTNGLEYFNDFESSIPTTPNGNLFGISMDGKIGKFGNSTSITYPNIVGSTAVHIGAPLLQSTAVNSWIGVGGNPLQGILLGNGVFEFNTLIQLNNLPDVTNQVTAMFGLSDTINQTISAINAIAFVLENANITTAPSGSVNFQCMTINSGVKTTTITSVAMSTNWVKFSIIINANASSVGFYIDNILVATHTTNIPTARLAIYTALNKRNIGTISMGYYIDYLHYKYDYTTKRL
jgi:hypothetical protein